MSRAPVAVFDSGVGGLSVAREIHAALPGEDLLYFADTAHVPYGDRSTGWVCDRSLAVGRWAAARGAKVLVVACNTASGAALERLREELAIPVIGLEPAVKPAVALSRSGRVGVMATVGTLASARYARLVAAHGGNAAIIPQPCPGLADLIEDGHLSDEALRAAVERFAAPLRDASVDTVVLGCTHYVFVRDAIQRAFGGDVRLVDSGPAIARRTRRVLEEQDALERDGRGELRVHTSAAPERVARVVARLWGATVPVLAETLAEGCSPGR